MARTDTLGNFLTDVAEAIRTKEGTTEIIPASEFDTRISNLSSGSTEKIPASTSELTTPINNIITSFIKDAKNYYDVYKDENMVFYTPNASCMFYAIRIYNGGYNIMWFPETVLRYYNNSNFYSNGLCVNTITSTGENASGGTISWSNTKIDIYYSSNNYTTLDECIEAMKNPETVYTPAWNYIWPFERDNSSAYILPASNLPLFAGEKKQKMMRVSSNETIKVIGE